MGRGVEFGGDRVEAKEIIRMLFRGKERALSIFAVFEIWLHLRLVDLTGTSVAAYEDLIIRVLVSMIKKTDSFNAFNATISVSSYLQ